MEVHEKVDDGREEVLCRVGEERLRTAFLLAAALVERCQQGSRRFRSRRKVGDVLPLYGIDAVGILHIGKVDGAETAVGRQPAGLPVLAELVEERLGKRGVLEVIDHHGEPLGGVLPDERVNDTEGLSRTGRSQHNCPTERVDDVYPSPVHLPFPIVYHGNVHRIVVGDQCLRLLERLVLEVEAVFAHLVVVILGDAVQPLMHQHGADNRADGVEDAVGRETEPADAEIHPVEHEAQPDKGQPGQHGIDHHRAHIELQRLLRLGADTDDADAHQLRHLAARYGVEYLETPQQIENELRDAVVRRDRQVHHNLYNQEDVNATAEIVVHLLLFPCLFKCHAFCFVYKWLKRNSHSKQQPVAERVAVQEVHVVLLYQGELPAVTEYIAVFKPSLQSDEEPFLHRAELRAEAETQHTVLIAHQPVLVDDAAVPIVAFPEILFLPMGAGLAVQFHGIPV